MDVFLFTVTTAGYLVWYQERSGRGEGERQSINTAIATVSNTSSSHDEKKSGLAEPITGAIVTNDNTTTSATESTTQKQQQHRQQQQMMRSTIAARKLAKKWLTSFRGTDPRWKLAQFFSDELVFCCQKQKEELENEDLSTVIFQRTSSLLASPTTSVFTVWRPTSAIAIRLMMAGKATGKGLEIKGKSAKAGHLSGFVPFLQIHKEQHKTAVATISKAGRVRVFFPSEQQRNVVLQHVQRVRDEMLLAVEQAKRVILKSIERHLKQQHDDHVPSSHGVGVHKAIAKFKKSVKTKSRSSSSSSSPKSASPMSVKGFGISIVSQTEKDNDEREMALRRLLLWDMGDPSIVAIDEYANAAAQHHHQCCHGIDLPNRVLWQALVVDADISRPANGSNKQHYTGRPSQPAFQDLNWMAINKTRNCSSSSNENDVKDGRCVVLWYIDCSKRENCNDDNDCDKKNDSHSDLAIGLDPRNLVMAYEEHGRVLPVVSDFDCFTMGTRGIDYKNSSLPDDQVDLIQWCLDRIEGVLDKQQQQQHASTNWTSDWLEVLKASAVQGFHPTVPEFGFGDVQSYQIMERAVAGLQETGAVRHGAECFNYYFPQELDAEFLIVYEETATELQPSRQHGGTATSKKKMAAWQYVNIQQLQAFLLEKIEQGFTFPLNPKWILCDDGWKNVYNLLLSSHRPDVQDSINVWFPPDSGIRQKIESISARCPHGFAVCPKPKVQGKGGEEEEEVCGTEAMDLATLELDRYMTLRRAKAKVRAAVKFGHLASTLRQEHHY